MAAKELIRSGTVVVCTFLHARRRSRNVACAFISREKFVEKKLTSIWGDYQKHENGMLWRDLTVGDGDSVPEEDGAEVGVHFHGAFEDGTPFESSVHLSGLMKPTLFRTGQTDGTRVVIDAIDDAVRGMRIGGVRQLLVPPFLAHPMRCHDVLIYEVTLVAIEPSKSGKKMESLWQRIYKALAIEKK